MAIQTYSGFNHSLTKSSGAGSVWTEKYGGRVFSPTQDIYISRFDYFADYASREESSIYLWNRNTGELLIKTQPIIPNNYWQYISLVNPVRLVSGQQYVIACNNSQTSTSNCLNSYSSGNKASSHIIYDGIIVGGTVGNIPATFLAPDERTNIYTPTVVDFQYQTYDYKYLLRDMRVGVKTLNSNIQQINNLHIDPVLEAVSKSKDFTSTSFYFPISKGIEYDFTIKNSANLNIAGTLDKNPADLTEAESRSLMRLIDNKTLPNGYLPYTLNFKQQEGENYFLAQVSDEENTPEVNLIGTAPYVLYNYDEEGNLQELDEQNITTNTFITYGFDEPPTAEDLVKLGHPSVMYWQEYNVNPQFTATVEALPPSQTVISDKIDLTNETILGIDSMTVDCEGGLLLAVSFDDKKTWKVWTGDAWATTENEFTGMTKDMVESITYDQWNELYQGATGFYIRVAFINPSQSVKQVYVRFLGN